MKSVPYSPIFGSIGNFQLKESKKKIILVTMVPVPAPHLSYGPRLSQIFFLDIGPNLKFLVSVLKARGYVPSSLSDVLGRKVLEIYVTQILTKNTDPFDLSQILITH